MIQLEKIIVKRGELTLFDELTLVVHTGHKVGVVGRNGAGKSTLFSLIRGRLAPEEGDVRLPPSWTIAHLAQEVEAADRPALAWVLDGDRRLRRVQARIHAAEEAGDHDALGHLYTELEDAGGYDAEARGGEILNGLGFAAADFDKPYASFSGGWRIRLNLAQTLMGPSDLLLLDEPTNHLDLDATLWLEAWLGRYRGTLLTIAHDRDFLDSVVDHIAHISDGAATIYRGNYTAFERQRAETLAREQALYAKQQREAKRIETFVERFRAKATKARQVQSRVKALERLLTAAPAHADSGYEFSFPNPEKMSVPLVHLEGAALGYQGTAVLTIDDLRINPGDRIGVLGANGAGKSTLVKTLAGDLDLVSGELHRGHHSKVGYFAQHQLEQLDTTTTPLAALEATSPTATEQAYRNYLGGWGFKGDAVNRAIRYFSGGEKARLVLALIAWQRPAVLFLDEPTNHLDLDMRHALSVALQNYNGALVLVAHDRELLAGTVESCWLVADGAVVEFSGGIDAYTEQVRSAVRSRFGRADTATTHHKRTNRRTRAEQREQTKPLRDRIRATERDIETITTTLAVLEEKMADPDTYDTLDKDAIAELVTRQGQLRKQLQAAEQDWLEAHDALEREAG